MGSEIYYQNERLCLMLLEMWLCLSFYLCLQESLMDFLSLRKGFDEFRENTLFLTLESLLLEWMIVERVHVELGKHFSKGNNCE